MSEKIGPCPHHICYEDRLRGIPVMYYTSHIEQYNITKGET